MGVLRAMAIIRKPHRHGKLSTKPLCSLLNAKKPLSHSLTNKKSSSPIPRKCDTCRNFPCQCGVSSGKGKYCHKSGASNPQQVHKEKSFSPLQISMPKPKSDEAANCFKKEDSCPNFQPTTLAIDTAAADVLGRSLLSDQPMSPRKELRIAMLKSRFADTILKAEEKLFLLHGSTADLGMMKKETERLESRQREVKARIEVEAAKRLKEVHDLKKLREKEREAARIALQKMEETVVIEQNLDSFEELEMLAGCSLSYRLFDNKNGSKVVMGACVGDHFWNPLEKLGLFMKDDYYQENEVEENVLTEDVKKEKDRIEVEAARRHKTTLELEMLREEKREAARVAIQKMEDTVVIEQNLDSLKELETLSGCRLSYRLVDDKNGSKVITEACAGDNFWNPLEKLGLYLKDDYWGNDDQDNRFNGDIEEGEIPE